MRPAHSPRATRGSVVSREPPGPATATDHAAQGSKAHAAAGSGTPWLPAVRRVSGRAKLEQRRTAAAPGLPGSWRRLGLALLLLLGAAGAAAAGACPPPALRFEPLAPGLWWIPAAGGDADAANRGQVSNLLLAEDGRRLWLLGSGPTPAFGRALACQVQRQFGRPVTDVVSPWPRPELVLGLAGLGRVRSWAHAEVAAAMRQRCPGCVERLRARLGTAAQDLGAAPVRVPDRHLTGASGRLGPWQWWLLGRGPGFPVTVWEYAGSQARYAPGLLWGDGPPDGRDADLDTLERSTRTLAEGLPDAASARQWLGEQGPPLPADAPQAHLRYWMALRAAVAAAVARGDADSGAPAPIAGFESMLGQPRHALNWQRAFRQAEEAFLQRNLR